MNPYESSADSTLIQSADRSANENLMTIGLKTVLIVGGMSLYLSNVTRDANFYRTILDNEGFPTTSDSLAVGIAGSLIATFMLSPVALFLIGYGIGRCSRLQLIPRFDRFTYVWGTLATFVLIMMLFIESDYLVYSVPRPQHWQTTVFSLLYVVYMYVWWCCSIAHGRERSANSP